MAIEFAGDFLLRVANEKPPRARVVQKFWLGDGYMIMTPHMGVSAMPHHGRPEHPYAKRTHCTWSVLYTSAFLNGVALCVIDDFGNLVAVERESRACIEYMEYNYLRPFSGIAMEFDE